MVLLNLLHDAFVSGSGQDALLDVPHARPRDVSQLNDIEGMFCKHLRAAISLDASVIHCKAS